MSNKSTTVNFTISSSDSIPPIVKFWFYLVLLIPSIICTLFVLYYLLFDRTLRHSLNNHVIIVLLFTVLFCELTQYPWMLYYHAHGNIWSRPYIFCFIWGFIDWAVYMLQLLLFAWASIERHILIFHDRWVATKKKRFFVHYLPPVIIIIYWLIFYTYVYFYPSCQNHFDSSQMICMTVCSFDSFSFHAFDTLFNNIIPSLTIVIFSVALLVRILRQKYRIRHQIQWRKHRKMTIQTLSISILYLLITAPWAMIIFLRICGLPSNVGVTYENYATFIDYFIVLLFPFVALLSLPELSTKVKKLLHLHRQRRLIEPQILVGRNVRNNTMVET